MRRDEQQRLACIRDALAQGDTLRALREVCYLLRCPVPEMPPTLRDDAGLQRANAKLALDVEDARQRVAELERGR